MKMKLAVVALLLTATTGFAQTAEQKVQTIVSGASFRNAKAFLDSDHQRFVKELITLTEIPAPPFKEDARRAAYLEMLRAAKLTDVERDAEGNLIANAPHMPVHLGSMGESIKTVIRENAGSMHPGDVYVLNDPYHGGTHLPDITVITPVYLGDSEVPTFYVGSRGHHAEIGRAHV